jgi:hypothetical protein
MQSTLTSKEKTKRDFLNAEKIDEHLNCIICEEIFIDPVMNSSC